MQFKRFLDTNDKLYEKAIGLYERNFIIDERRDADEQRRVLKNPHYNCQAVIDGEMVGIAFFWETDSFIYLEHLCIVEKYRGRGYGSKVLNALKERNKILILEIEPVVDEKTAKRKLFYEKNGFYYNEHLHIQPKYHVGDEDLILWIMSYGRTISKAEYDAFYSFLMANVQILPVKTAEVEILPLTSEKDYSAVAELIYYSDNYIYPYMLNGVEEAKRLITQMIKTDTIYNAKNVTLAKHGDTVVGAMVSLKSPFTLQEQAFKDCFSACNIDYTENTERVWNEYYNLLGKELSCEYIANVCVSSRYRGNGIAGKLMKSIFDKDDTFVLECVKANTFAVKCYEKLGFVIQETYGGFTGIPCYKMKKGN